MIPNLDVDQMKTFLAIADTGSFTKAAAAVNKTQSAVSMQMKRLEESLGRALFERDGRGSRFTPDGERFVEQARRLAMLHDDIVMSYATPALSGVVRFGTPDDYADLFLPEVLARFARSHPLVTVDVVSMSSGILMERLRRNELDLSLVTFCGAQPEGEVLRREELRWVGSVRHSAHLAKTLPIATADFGCDWRTAAVNALTRANRPFRVAYTSANRSIIDAAVLQGLAVAAMPEICMRPGMRLLTESDGFPRLNKIEIGLLKRPGRLTQATEALANHIRESFGSDQPRLAVAG